MQNVLKIHSIWFLPMVKTPEKVFQIAVAFESIHDYAKLLFNQFIHQVWLWIRLDNLIARHKTADAKSTPC